MNEGILNKEQLAKVPSKTEWYIFDVCRYKLMVPCLDLISSLLIPYIQLKGSLFDGKMMEK